MAKAKWLLFFAILFIFSACTVADDVENTTETQVQENSTTIK